jgi:hypothetical protein
MELQHVQGSNIHPLPRSVDIVLNIFSCHLDWRWYPFCKPECTDKSEKTSDSKNISKMHQCSIETQKNCLLTLDFFEQLRWALTPDSIDEHTIQILCRTICRDNNYVSVPNGKHV